MEYKEIKWSHILTWCPLTNNEYFVSDWIFVITEGQAEILELAKTKEIRTIYSTPTTTWKSLFN
jgi:hypothetical protein